MVQIQFLVLLHQQVEVMVDNLMVEQELMEDLQEVVALMLQAEQEILHL